MAKGPLGPEDLHQKAMGSQAETREPAIPHSRIGLRREGRRSGAFAQTVFLISGLMGVQKSLFAAQKSLFDNSFARLHCKSKTRPSGSDRWICGRYASLRTGHEKISIHAQTGLFHFLRVCASKTIAWVGQGDLGNGPYPSDLASLAQRIR
jgi:hypothetical protein